MDDYIEDNYRGRFFNTWEEFLNHFAGYCEDDLYGMWNVPVWLHNEGENDFEHGPTLTLGVMLTRHGECIQWQTPFPGEEQYTELKARILRIWAGRAESGFARHSYTLRLNNEAIGVNDARI